LRRTSVLLTAFDHRPLGLWQPDSDRDFLVPSEAEAI
jgi:hypothetical protein